MPVHNSPAALYFDRLLCEFRRAERRCGCEARDFLIGGHPIRFRFAGAALVPALTRALAHAATASVSAPELEVNIWDSASAGIPMPEPPWDVRQFNERGEMWGVGDGPVLAAFEGGENPQLCVLDRDKSIGIYWAPSAGSISFWEKTAPMRTLLHWWLRDLGCQLVHAAAVGSEEGGVLLGGKGNSGKSTTAMACLDCGLRYASDDYTLLIAQGRPEAVSLYSSAKFDYVHLQTMFPTLPAERPEPGLKSALYLFEHCPDRLIGRFPLKAVVLPHVTGHDSSALRPVSAAFGLSAIAPSTIFQLRWARQQDLHHMGAALGQVPIYILELGRNLPEAAALIRNLLKGDGRCR